MAQNNKGGMIFKTLPASASELATTDTGTLMSATFTPFEQDSYINYTLEASASTNVDSQNDPIKIAGKLGYSDFFFIDIPVVDGKTWACITLTEYKNDDGDDTMFIGALTNEAYRSLFPDSSPIPQNYDQYAVIAFNISNYIEGTAAHTGTDAEYPKNDIMDYLLKNHNTLPVKITDDQLHLVLHQGGSLTEFEFEINFSDQSDCGIG